MRSERLFFRSIIAAALLAAAAGAPARAWAQAPAAGAPSEADLAQARERFGAARKLEDAGKWAEALTLFQRVAEVKTTPQVRFHVALCMENVGLWTQALDGYAQAVSEAGTSAPEVVKEANEHIRNLTASIPTVTVRVEGGAPGDELYLDRRRIPGEDPPLPLRADPGPHTAEVRRAGAVVAREVFALDPHSTRRVQLRVGTIAPAPPGSDPQPKPPSEIRYEPPPVIEPPPPPPPHRDPGRGQRIAGWSVIGAGAASFVAAGVFGAMRGDALSRLTEACPSLSGCPRSVESIVSDGKTDALLVNVFATVGGAAIAGGAALLLLAPSAPPAQTPASKASRIELAPAGGAGMLGFTARGIF